MIQLIDNELIDQLMSFYQALMIRIVQSVGLLEIEFEFKDKIKNLKEKLQTLTTNKIFFQNKARQMNLKQHNDIVQKLLGQIQLKDKQITKLNKQITAMSKTSTNIQGKSKVPSPSQIEKQVQKRITQLNKQHNAKVSQLNQEIKTLTQENNQLKQRLALKNNLDHKEKQHIAQVIKKNIDRKPGSQHDIKITSLVTHYQAQLNKKNTFIQTLKRQVKSLSINQSVGNNDNGKKGQFIETKITNMDFDCGEEDNTQRGNQEKNRKTIPILEHNQKVQKLQKTIKTLQEKIQINNTELNNLRNNYNQLTKQYYRILNQYGIEAASIADKTDKNSNNNNIKKPQSNQFYPTNNKLQSSQLSKSSKINKDSRISFNLTDDQQDSCPQTINSFPSMADPNDASISIDFEQNFKKFSQRPKIFPQQQEEDQNYIQKNILEQQNLVFSSKTTFKPFHKNSQKVFTKPPNPQLTQSILQVLNLTQQDQILPELSNLMTKQSFTQLNEQIIKAIHEILYKFGMGKVPRSQMPQSLQVLSSKCSTWLESYDLINEICIQLGAKRNKLMEKIAYYKNSQLQYLQKMKNITFLTQLNKSHKLLEFINFFELDKSELQLPQQLKNIYQQLKYVDKFIKQAHMTMALSQRKNLEDMLQLILRKIQTYHEWQVELRKQNQRKAINKHATKFSVINNDKS